MPNDPADPDLTVSPEPPRSRDRETRIPQPVARRTGRPRTVARRPRLAAGAIPPDRLEQIRERLLSGFYETPEVRARIAARIRPLLG